MHFVYKFEKLTIVIIFKKFILIFTLPLLLLPSALGEGVAVRISDKSQVIQKNNTDCATDPCPTDVDRLLDILGATEEEKNGSLNINNDQEQSEELSHAPLKIMKRAQIVVLNKITSKSEQVIFDVGRIKFFGNLSLEVHKCIQSTDPYEPNNLMLLTIFDNKIDEDRLAVFHGWVVTSNPSLSTFEHPVYEVIPQICLPAEAKTIQKN